MLDNYWNLVLSKKKIGSRKERTFVTVLLHLTCSAKEGRIEVSLLFRSVITGAVIVGLMLGLKLCFTGKKIGV